MLLNNGAPVDGRNDNDETPLFYALKAGPRADMPKSVDLLLSRGADPNHKDRFGKTPLGITRSMKRSDRNRIIALLE